MPLVKDALAAADGATVHRALEEHGAYELALDDGSSVTLGPDDIEVRVRSHEEFVLAEDAGYAVALDTILDDDLRAEGIARDLIRAINDRRKELDFDIADRIRVRITATGRVEAAAHRHRDCDRARGARGGVRRAPGPGRAIRPWRSTAIPLAWRSVAGS